MPKVDYANLKSSGDFAAAAHNIASRGTSLKKDVQKALICGLKHMDAHGDYTSSVIPLLDAIKLAFGKNLHMAALEWTLKFSWLAWDENAKALHKDQNKVMDVKGSEAVNWWETERAAKARPFDAQAAIAKLFDQFKAEAEAGRGTLDMFTSLIVAKLFEQNPNLVTDLFLDLDAPAQNEALAVMVAVMTPANVDEPAEVEAVEQVAAAA